MRLLVTGAGGLLGGRLALLLHRQGHQVLALTRRSPPPPGPRAVTASIDDDASLAALLDSERPQAVVHAAALARVELCHERPAEAEAVNTRLAGRLAASCRERRLRLVALSTDLVLAGDRPFASEAAPARPSSVYGRSKRAGEDAVLAADPGAAVARVALVVGQGHGARASASEAVVWSLFAGRQPFLFRDEFRTPIDPESVADAVQRLLDRPAASGRFHLGGAERLSRYELGVRAARALGLDEKAILSGRQAERPAAEPRPRDVSLDSTRARRELGWEARPLDEALKQSRPDPSR